MLVDCLRKISESHTESRVFVNEQYHKRAREFATKEATAKKQHSETSKELMAIEETVKASCDLVDLLVQDVKEDRISKLGALATTNADTRKLFYQEYNAPHLAVSCGSARVFGEICELARKYPPECRFDYRSSLQGFPPIYDVAFSHKNPAFSQLMTMQLLHDLEDIVTSQDLSWLVTAIRLKPTLINTQREFLGSSRTEKNSFKPTIAMCLAEHNQLLVLKEILKVLEKQALDDKAPTLPAEYNFFTKRDIAGKAVVHYALKEGHGELALWLLEQDKSALSPLEKACQEGGLEEVQSLMTLLETNPAEHEQAALMLAIIAKQPVIVAELLKSGRIKVEYKDHLALLTAVRYGHLEMAKMLIEAGGDICAQDNLALRIINQLTPENSGLTSEQVNTRQIAVRSFMEQYRHTSPIFIKQQEAARQAQERAAAAQKALAAQQAQELRERKIKILNVDEQWARTDIRTSEEESRRVLKNSEQTAAVEARELTRRNRYYHLVRNIKR